MATQITSTQVSVDFHNDVIEQIPNELTQFGLSASQKAVVSTSVYHVDTTQAFPQTPPSWVMSHPYLALLVTSGEIAVA
jgi:hypothetical protein